jgi:AcrR family transcriptional regulator
MALPRFARLDADKRAMIIGVATEEFASRGYAQASLNRIIARCGLSKGALYYYFADKDDLYETVLDLFCEAILERWSGGTSERIPAFSRCETTGDYWQEWISHFRRSMCHDLENPVDAELFRRSLQARASGTSHPALSRVASRIREWIREALARGQQIGAVRTDLPNELLLDVSFGLMEGFDIWITQEPDESREGRVDELAALVVRLLRRVTEAAAVPHQGG